MPEGRSSVRSRFEWDDGDPVRCDPTVQRLLELLLRLTRKGVLRWDRIGVREAAPTSHDSIDIPGVIRFRTWTSSSGTRSSLKLDIIWMDWSPMAMVRLCTTGKRSEVSIHRVPRELPTFRRLLESLLGEGIDSSKPEVLATALSIVEEVSAEHDWVVARRSEAAAEEPSDALEW